MGSWDGYGLKCLIFGEYKLGGIISHFVMFLAIVQ